MKGLKDELMILNEGETPPSGTVEPPRQPQQFDTFKYIADPDQFCRQNLAEYGPIFQTSVFGGTTVFVGTARANQMVLNGDLQYTEISLPPTTMDMFGEYSLFQRPDLHRERKGALTPAFTGKALDGYLPHINQTIVQGLNQWKNYQRVALFPSVEKISFDVLVPLLLGVNLNSPDAFQALPLYSKVELKTLYKTFFDGFYGLIKWKSPLTAYGRGYKAREKLIDFMGAVMERRRHSGESLAQCADFLSMMLSCQQKNPQGVFSDIFIKNQCLLQLWASHYEISGLLSSLIYKIGEYPQVKQRIIKEQKELLPQGNSEKYIDSNFLNMLTYLDATIKETLRVLSPTSTANRRLTKSVILDGVLFKKGWVVIAEPRIAHLLTEHFSQPEEFNPERFLPPRNEGKMYQFIPFGGGVHACLGAQMAIVIAKVFISHLISLLDWKLTQKADFVQFPLKRIKDNYLIDISEKL